MNILPLNLEIDYRIRKMIKDIDISDTPCADDVNAMIDEARSSGMMTNLRAESLKDHAAHAVVIQKRRLQQVMQLTRGIKG